MHRQFLYDRLNFEPLLPSAAVELREVAQVSDSRVKTTACRRRIESLSLRYLDGHKLHIQSASLRGPFGRPWRSPWHRDAAQIIDIADNVPTPTIKDSTETHARVRNGLQKERWPVTAPHKPAAPARAESPLSHGHRRSPVEPSTTFVSLPQQPKRGNTGTITVPYNDPSPHQKTFIDGPIKPAISANPDVSDPQLRSLPTPSNSSSSDDGYEESTPDIVVGTDATLSRPTATVTKASRELRTPAFHPVNRPVPTAERDRLIKFDTIGAPKGQPHAPEKTCSNCQTTESYQWRRGPQGPGTLCCSCGSKWTHEQKKSKSTANDELRTTTVAQGKGRKYANYKVRLESIKRAWKVGSKEEGNVRELHEEIYRKVFPESLEQMDQRLNGKAVDLRQRLDPRIEKWSQQAGELSNQTPSSFSSRVVSPRKERRKRQVDFDTPKAQAKVQSTDPPPQERRGQPNNISAPSDGAGDDSKASALFEASVPLDATSLDSSSTKVYPSTQVMMQNAFNDFRDAFTSPEKHNTPRPSSQGTIYPSARQRLGRKALSPQKQPGSALENTQDLISLAMSHEESPMKQPEVQKRASFDAGFATRSIEVNSSKAYSSPQVALKKSVPFTGNTTSKASRSSFRYTAYNSGLATSLVQQEDAQESNPFDLDAAIEMGQGFLEI